MKKIITPKKSPELKYAEVVGSPQKKKILDNFKEYRGQVLHECNNYVQELTEKEKLKEMQLIKMEEKRERGDPNTIFMLINQVEEVNNVDLLLTNQRNKDDRIKTKGGRMSKRGKEVLSSRGVWSPGMDQRRK